MLVTMKDIARIAGVSQAAVSAAFNFSGTTRISDELRTRILHIARDLNYVPNASAQRLKGSKTHTIGIFGVPYVSILTQAFMLNLSLDLASCGYNLLSCYGETEDAAFRATKELISKGIDGMLITTDQNPLLKFKLPPVPYVFAPPWRVPGFDFTIDHKYGNYLSAKKLLDSGCGKIGFLCMMNKELSDPNESTVSAIKLSGVQKALKQAGIEMPADFMLTHEAHAFKVSNLVNKIKRLELDALICANDYIAAKILRPLIQAGLSVPDKIKVFGYDGLSICDFTAVPLATVIQPMAKLSKLCVSTLLERIENKDHTPKACEKLLKPKLYNNESCGSLSPNYDKLGKLDSYSTIELNSMLIKKEKRNSYEKH